VKKIIIYDSTLRDGTQAQGISYSVEDKLKIVKKLDALGIKYIEAGNPGSNPKEIEFFERLKVLKFNHSKIIAFGSTRKIGIETKDDSNIQSLLNSGTSAVAIFGKSWDFHVTNILKTSLEENLNMIFDTISYFKSFKKEVVFDAEHFFDGYKANSEYALKSLEFAVKGGADSICLCDTNGGTFPRDIFDIVSIVANKFNIEIGIHCHNDNGMAVANTIMAIDAGATQVQGTINGFGERCGNTNLCTIIPNLQLKMGLNCIPDNNITNITSTARYISEIANVVHNERDPYIGKYAFAHKAGMHADAVNKDSSAYEHINPLLVGNERTFLMSEVAGRSAVMSIINKVDNTLTKDSKETKQIIDKLKEMEYMGYQYEGAESSFELIIRKILGTYKPLFKLVEFKVIINEPSVVNFNSTAVIKIIVENQEEITAAEGDGPVNAIDNAIRKALLKFYPELSKMKLSDYKVRVLDSNSASASASKVRVLIESTDGKEVWTTIGVSSDIIDASWQALVDSIEYKIVKYKST